MIGFSRKLYQKCMTKFRKSRTSGSRRSKTEKLWATAYRQSVRQSQCLALLTVRLGRAEQRRRGTICGRRRQTSRLRVVEDGRVRVKALGHSVTDEVNQPLEHHRHIHVLFCRRLEKLETYSQQSTRCRGKKVKRR